MHAKPAIFIFGGQHLMIYLLLEVELEGRWCVKASIE
jgi:hypothetical protein